MNEKEYLEKKENKAREQLPKLAELFLLENLVEKILSPLGGSLKQKVRLAELVGELKKLPKNPAKKTVVGSLRSMGLDELADEVEKCDFDEEDCAELRKVMLGKK